MSLSRTSDFSILSPESAILIVVAARLHKFYGIFFHFGG